jgi:hypothetical protein
MFRIAHYMIIGGAETEGHKVDCDYNRHGNEVKRMIIAKEETVPIADSDDAVLEAKLSFQTSYSTAAVAMTPISSSVKSSEGKTREVRKPIANVYSGSPALSLQDWSICRN